MTSKSMSTTFIYMLFCTILLLFVRPIRVLQAENKYNDKPDLSWHNLSRIDVFMMTSFFANHTDFTSAEIEGVKAARSERYSYGDSAIGYVQVNREANICVVKQKCYSVTAVCDEAEQRIVSAECEDCAADLSGCKYAIAFIAWLHRRSEDPPSASINCYWKKSKLSTIGTTLKYIRDKELGSSSKTKPAPSANT